MDLRSRLEALSCFTRKPPAFGGFLATIYSCSFCTEHRLHGLLRNFLANGLVFRGKVN